VRRVAILIALVMGVLAATPRVAAAQAGWRELDLGGGRRATRYLPSGVRACDPLPLLLFLHGAGGTPEAYASHLEPHAEALGLVLLLPQSSGSSGWGGADATTLNAALDTIAMEVNVDDTRTYLGGHSAGGAFAYLLTYDSEGIAAVFSMSAPYYAVSSVAEAGYAAPIHMYYGDSDPNYTGGSAMGLAMQWDRLGVPHETDVQAGYGHSSWPPSSIRAGLDFLVARRHPGAAPPSRCGDADAGVARDAGGADDAGVLALDAGVASDAASVPSDAGPRDGGPASGADASGRRGAISSGCGCRAGATTPPWAGLGLATPLGLALLRRRLARGHRPPSESLRAQRSRAH
jgi:predicted esterase